MIRYYYTLKDLLIDVHGGSYPDGYRLAEAFNTSTKPEIQYVVENVLTTSAAGGPTADQEVNKLWCQYIVPKHFKDAIAYFDGREVDDYIAEESIKDWITYLMMKIRSTRDKYVPIIDYYSASESDLLNQISATSVRTLDTKTEYDTDDNSTSRMNDTPQNGGDFTSDSYTSAYTTTGTKADQETKNTGTDTIVTSTDRDSLIERLTQIREEWKDIYKQWCEEFDGLFFRGGEWYE